VKSKNGKLNKGLDNKQVLTNKIDNNTKDNKSTPAQEDGFRYDYNDSSDFKDDIMS
jgi:hypothetical protein